MTPDEAKRYVEFLDELRDSGRTNMWGSRAYVVKAFKLPPERAGKICAAWMQGDFGASLDVRAIELQRRVCQ